MVDMMVIANFGIPWFGKFSLDKFDHILHILK